MSRRALVAKATISVIVIAAMPLLFGPGRFHRSGIKSRRAVSVARPLDHGVAVGIPAGEAPPAVTVAVSSPVAQPAVPVAPAAVHFGSRGPDVSAFQARLAERGWRLVVDGVDGPITTATIRAFQADKQLGIDGIGGPATWTAMWTTPITSGGASNPGPAPATTFTGATLSKVAMVHSVTSGLLGGVWACIRQHESGGNYSANTGNGYYGAYQFALSTWRALGGSGLPSDAPPSVQDAMAQKLQAMSGWAQWPVTSKMCGV